MLNTLYACIREDAGTAALFDIVAAPDAQAALKAALRRDLNADVRSDISRGCEVYAYPVAADEAADVMQAAAERHAVSVSTLLGDAVEYEVRTERERLGKRYRRRSTKARRTTVKATALTAVPAASPAALAPKAAPAVVAPPAGRLGRGLALAAEPEAAAPRKAAPKSNTRTPEQVAADAALRAQLEGFVRRADDGTATLAGVSIGGKLMSLEHAVNRACVIGRALRDAGRKIDRTSIRDGAIALGYVADSVPAPAPAAAAPAVAVVDLAETPAPAPAAPAAPAAKRAAPVRVAVRRKKSKSRK